MRIFPTLRGSDLVCGERIDYREQGDFIRYIPSYISPTKLKLLNITVNPEVSHLNTYAYLHCFGICYSSRIQY
jgi:hypothetical protein